MRRRFALEARSFLLLLARLRRRDATTALLLALAASLSVAPARAEIDRDEYRGVFPPDEGKGEVEVALVVPPGWDLSEQRTFPGLLVTAIHRERPGRLTLAAEKVGDGLSAKAYAEASRARLAKVGFQVGRLSPHPATRAVMFDAVAPDRRTVVRQAYLAHGPFVFVLTLASPGKLMRTYARAFDDTLRSLTLRASRAAGASAASETK